jgi:amino acid adenylation domain-containing protein
MGAPANGPVVDGPDRPDVPEWNDTAAPYPEATVPQLVEAQVARDPAAIAVIDPDGSLSYGELNQRANQLGHHLRTLGVGPEVTVGVSLGRGAEQIVGLLGVMKAGGAWVPLDPRLPGERLRLMMGDASCTVAVSRDDLALDLGIEPGRTVCLDTDAALLGSLPIDDLAPAGEPDDLAYVIYTSGSTGRPKGVGVCHRSVVNLLTTSAGRFTLGPADIWTMLHSFAFDFSVWEVWGALTTGGTLVVVPPGEVADGRSLAERLDRHRVSVLSITPQVFQLLAEGRADRTLDHLRLVVFGGAALTPAHLRPWAAAGPSPATLVNMYGITETTVHSTAWTLPTDVDGTVLTEGPVPIGAPLANTTLHVLDNQLRPVVAGEAGELCVGGVGVARGYVGRPELTAERFVPDPYGPPGARLYRSGDLGRQRPDGMVEYLGRSDDQVKVRGFRIELGEVEAALAVHPGVAQVAVSAREDRPGDRRLVAYVVPVTPRPGLVAELRHDLRGRLPDYMVPAAFVELDQLPLTGNGKVDRRALPAPGEARRDLDTAAVAPRRPEESALAGIVAEALALDEVGIDDNFFDLGGNSLLAVQVVAKASAEGLDVTLADLIERPTVRGALERPPAASVTPSRATAAPTVKDPPSRSKRGAARRWLGGRR